jgi:drug/metabolite transporter (DMT)-like permease
MIRIETTATPSPAEAIANGREIPFTAGLSVSLLCILFGANAVAIKVSLQGFGTFTTAALRFSTAVLVLLAWSNIRGMSTRVNRQQFLRLSLSGLFFTLQMSFVYLGLGLTYVTRGVLLSNLQPFFVLLLAHFFLPGDRITRRKLTGLALGFLGVVFVVSDRQGATGPFRWGDVFILCSTLFWALNVVYLKSISRYVSPTHAVIYPLMVSLPFFLAGSLFIDPDPIRGINAASVSALLYQSLVTASFGFLAWFTLLRTYGAVALHSFLFLMPIAGVFLSGLILSEPLTPNIITALFLVVSGICAINFGKREETAIR